MRGLSATFLHDLTAGVLRPLLDRVHLDRTLCLELRDDYVNIYYRGGNLLRLAHRGDAYVATFDTNYGKAAPTGLEVPAAEVRGPEHVAAWLEAMPHLKLAMDLTLGHHPKEEREIQQLVARDNNMGSVSRATDYYVCDIEYANAHGRFDIVAVHWPSTPMDRKRSDGRRLVIGEVKQGDNALSGQAGLHAHVRDIDRFLADPARLASLKEEMVAVFRQKRALGLIDCGRDLTSFSDEPPLVLLILANHDPAKTKLREQLATLPTAHHCAIRVVASSLVGYGLFDPGMLTVDEVLARPETSF